ncbi:MAG: type III-B CRISPR-associated protein Cas10/Cmr2 [Candidatus Obscuribacterales bacterium]|nr:type III-B CRISPR-associated protein Cas10/Cmr2 [Candidatus Obscuribacterales bacterium]
MTTHLLLITIGPVQDFIAQARRTRDLWFGSHLLSELARATARAVSTMGARLIFPALENNDPELEPCIESPWRHDKKTPLNIANKILAEIPDGIDPAQVARQARSELYGFWREQIANRILKDCNPLLAPDTASVCADQVDSLLEFNASWVPMSEYTEAREMLETAIAGRKNLRDFDPYKHQRGPVRKSSLDGGRESVLNSAEKKSELAKKLRIGTGEELDAIGLIKRAGGKPDQFVPLVNIAFSSWTQLAAIECADDLRRVKEACADTGVSSVRSDIPCGLSFPFDAEVFIESRWKNVFSSGANGYASEWGQKHIRPILKKLSEQLSEPFPYVACLVADGDKMGIALSMLKTAEEHRRFSRCVAKFATTARTIVEQEHYGALTYAGGDDVLAFLSLPEALACAEKLRQAFSSIMTETDLSPSCYPTLSVGIGIGHIMESMGDLLQLGRNAEMLAKVGFANESKKRNALAIILDKRSGGQRCWRASWDEDPVEQFQQSVSLTQEMSSRKIYEVGSILRSLPDPRKTEVVDSTFWTRVLRLEIQRCVNRTHSGEAEMNLEKIGLRIHQEKSYLECYLDALRWVDKLLIAQTIAAATPRLRKEARV